MRSPGERLRGRARDRVAARGRTWPAASAPPAAAARCCSTKASSSAAAPSKPARAWSSSPMRTPGPIQRVPARERQPAEQRRRPASSCRCRSGRRARPARPRRARGRAGRARSCRAAATAPSRRTVTSPERSPPPKRSCSSQRCHGLSTDLEALDRLLGRAHLRRLLLGALGALARGRSCPGRRGRRLGLARRPVSDHWRWRRARSVEPVALRRVGVVALLGVAGGGRAQLEVAGPAAAVLRRRCGRSRRARARA